MQKCWSEVEILFLNFINFEYDLNFLRIYVDVVVNHMAPAGASAPVNGTGGSKADPLARKFPAVPFSRKDFHQTCAISNYNNATNVRDCELASLPDLDQSKEHVRREIVNFMNHLIDLGVAGFRMDACKVRNNDDNRIFIYSMP